MKKLNRRRFIQSSSLIGASILTFGSSSINPFNMSSREFDILIKNTGIIDVQANLLLPEVSASRKEKLLRLEI